MIKLSVLVPSYNKAEYIKNALDSILIQKTNFDFNIIITDDGSTDKTLDIINGYMRKYPNKFVLLPSPYNQGLLSNIIKAYEFMNCEYFCCLDPDDYYTDSFFYQKAIDYLDTHSNFNIYASNTSCLTENNEIIQQQKELTKKIYDSTFEDMLKGKAVLGNTISSVFRNNSLNKEVISKIKKFIGDTYSEHAFREDDFRNRIHLERGKAHFVNEIVGVYRYTPTGLFRASNLLKKDNLKISAYILMYHFFEHKYPEFINLAITNLYSRYQFMKPNLNNLLSYPAADIIKFSQIITELSKIDQEYLEQYILSIKDSKKSNFKNCLFSVSKRQKKLEIKILGITIKHKISKKIKGDKNDTVQQNICN